MVVSWNDAAERNDSVASDAFVIPRISGSNVACSPFVLLDAHVLALEHDPVDELAREQLGLARALDPHLLQHLADDQLDVLVVDLDALRLVDLLHLGDEVQLGRGRALQREQLGRAARALVECVARLDDLARRDEQPRAPRQLVLDRIRELAVGSELGRDDRHLRAALGLLDLDAAADLREGRGALRVPRLEDLDHARQAVRDVGAGDAAGVERAHRQLRARLADRLRGDDADRVADLAHLAGGEEDAVAGLAHARLGAALEHRPDRDRRVGAELAPRAPRADRDRQRSVPPSTTVVLPGLPDASGLWTGRAATSRPSRDLFSPSLVRIVSSR